MKFVKRKASTDKSKYTVVKKSFLDDATSTVAMEEIPPELVLNFQTGIKIACSLFTLDDR